MDVDRILAELRAERDLIDQAIERLQLVLRLRSTEPSAADLPGEQAADATGSGTVETGKSRRARAGN